MSNKQQEPDKYQFSFAENPKSVDWLTKFSTATFPASELNELFTSYTYSTIIWEPSRAGKNFKSSIGVVLDFDDKPKDDKTATDERIWKIDEVVAVLKEKQIAHALITSRSHTSERHCFHVFIPFRRPVVEPTEYLKITDYFFRTLFPGSDTSCTDLARQIYASPKGATYLPEFDLPLFDVDSLSEEKQDQSVINFFNMSQDTRFVSGAWGSGFQVKRFDGSLIDADSVETKESIHCPFHDDRSPSAFVAYHEPSENHFVHCSTCKKTWWKAEDPIVVQKKISRFYSCGKTIYEASVSNEGFHFQDIGKEKFLIRSKAPDKEQGEVYYREVVNNKHLTTMPAIEYFGGPKIEKAAFDLDIEACKVRAVIPVLKSKIIDNGLIEDYLKGAFGVHVETIKLYMALLIFTNYKRLPTLILIGDRSVGKTTFFNLLASAYPFLSTTIKTVISDFNSFAGKRLIGIDEGYKQGKQQYDEFKRLSGSEWLTINEKYKPEYQVRNNSNLVILSNDLLPISVVSEELPTDPAANQFLVLRLSKPIKNPDPEFGQKLIDRFGNYIQTELRSIYEKHNTSVGRYSMLVPITEWEKDLFKNNMGDVDHVVEAIVDVLVTVSSKTHLSDFSEELVKAGLDCDYILNSFINDQAVKHKVKVNDVHERLTSKDICEPLRDDPKNKYDRPRINEKRLSGRKITSSFRKQLAELINPTP